MEILSKLRTANDKLLRGLAQTQSLAGNEPAKAQVYFQQEVEVCGKQVINAYWTLHMLHSLLQHT